MSKAIDNQIDHFLSAHQLKKTAIRCEVLSLYLSKPYALSQHDVEQSLSKKEFDRITLYRTLKTFEECGIIHKVYNTAGVAKYAVCGETCSHEGHADEHAHFNCMKCENTYCLPSVTAPKITVPKGFKSMNFTYNIDGVCETCIQKGKK
jgi:Fur family ferric uptake transcriptional regulator